MHLAEDEIRCGGDGMNVGLLFDLDGVLVDTATYHYLAWKEIANELGIEFNTMDNERLKGVSRKESFQIILDIGNREMSEVEQEIYCTNKNKIYLNYIERLTSDECLPGVKDFLVEAKEKGYKIGLGSASKNAKVILTRIGLLNYFDAIVDGTDVTKAKPDSEVFVKGAKKLRVNQLRCIVFEDAFAGIEAAHRAGMKAIGVGIKELLPQADMNMHSFVTDREKIWAFIQAV